MLSVPVGDALLGRVIDPLGQPIDGKGPITTSERRLLETQAPSVVERQPVREPLQTGIKTIDAMTPIGRGQRQLIIGDRQTGKTAIVVDTIINQKSENVKCVYVAIGQKASTVAEVVDALESAGAMEYTVVVNAPASSAAALQGMPPMRVPPSASTGCTRASMPLSSTTYLSKQAVAYREISLLLRRPLAARRTRVTCSTCTAACSNAVPSSQKSWAAVLLTGLPIVETKANDVSAYIPTNVISITDGQIFLETDLFFSGVRPAMNAGVSVSRVGGDAQISAMKKVAGPLRVNLAQFRELEAFAEFGSELDAASLAQLERGRRVVEVLKQGQFQPVPVEEQVLAIYSVTNGLMDDIPTEHVGRFETELRDYFRTRYSQVLDGIRTSGQLPEAGVIDEGVAAFKESFSIEEDG